MKKNLQQFFPFCFRLFDCCLLLPLSLLGHLAVESYLQVPLHRLQVLESVQTPDPALMIPPPTSPQEGQSAVKKTLQARKTTYQAEDSSGNTSRRSWSCTDCMQRLWKDRDTDRQKQRQRTWAVRLDANRASTRASICVSSPTTDLTIFLPFCSTPHLLLLLCEKALFSCSHKPTRMLTASGCYVMHLCFYSRKNNSPRAVHICSSQTSSRHQILLYKNPKTQLSCAPKSETNFSLSLQQNPHLQDAWLLPNNFKKSIPRNRIFVMTKQHQHPQQQQFLLAASIRSDFFSSSSFFKP